MSLVTIKGPMFSGKSLMLMYLAKRRRIAKRKGEHIIVFKWAADRRHAESQARTVASQLLTHTHTHTGALRTLEQSRWTDIDRSHPRVDDARDAGVH
jgi:thymidine kinase